MAKVTFTQHCISRARKSLQILSRSIVEYGITFHLRLEALKLVHYCVRNSSSCGIDENTRRHFTSICFFGGKCHTPSLTTEIRQVFVVLSSAFSKLRNSQNKPYNIY
jgi:hypothetical protein